jgi:hypothetical protein
MGGQANEAGFHFIEFLFAAKDNLDIFFGPLLLGNIPGDLGEALQDMLVVIERGEDDVGVEDGPVLALAQSYTLVAAIFQGALEVEEGLSEPVVFIGIKDGNVLADDLGFAISFDLLGAIVPAHDTAFRINEENSIVFDMPDEETEPLFRALPGRFRQLSGC